VTRVALLASAAIVGCSGGEGASPDGPPAGLPPGWPDTLADHPADFGALVAPDRGAWIAWHGGDVQRGVGSVPPLAGLAQAELADTEAALAAGCAVAWARLAGRWPDPAVRPALAALAALAEPGPLGEVPTEAPAAVAACRAAHVAARGGGPEASCAPLRRVGGGPDGATDAWPDPMVHGTRAARAGQQADPPLPFTAAWSEADRADPLHGPTVAAVAPGLLPAGDDDPAAVQGAVATLDAALATWSTAAHDRADADGDALLDDLQLADLWRARVLAAAARAHLQAGEPRSAAALLDLARDLRSPRAVGPVNRPELFALTAWAALETGRAREALDALAPLRPTWPHVEGCVAIVEDLVVLEGMARVGDSRER
jgi:hypothetical protein